MQLVQLPVDVIVTDSAGATKAAANATRTIPIVIGVATGDPVALRGEPAQARWQRDWHVVFVYSTECQAFAAAQACISRYYAGDDSAQSEQRRRDEFNPY